MERKESANGLQLIQFAAIKLRGHFSTLFMGTFAMCTPLILVLAIPMLLAMLLETFWIFTIGVLLFVLMAGPLQIGYIKFFNGTINGEQPRVRSIFSHFKFSVNTLKYIYFVGILFILYVLGFCIWIVPAGFAVAFFSMVLFFQEKFEYTRFSSAFKDCAMKMLGNRLAMFSYKLIFYFVYFLLFCMAGVSLCLIYTLSLESILVAYIVTICTMIVFIFLYTMITVYFHSANQIFFEDTLMFHERKAEERAKEKAAKLKKKEEAEKVNEESKPEEKVGVAKEKTVKKTTAKKSPETKKEPKKKTESAPTEEVK
ncbi:MAG: hypothetical protein E7354_00035 [Clostridiales bacterium]|nr:hypothetical protein [Clostridiales bacterium]